MAEHEKKRGFIDLAKDGLRYASQIISGLILPPLTEGAELVMKTLDDRLLSIEKRIIRRISTFLIIAFGGIFLVFSVFSFLREILGWSNMAAYFSIGIAVFVTGLMLKIGDSTN